MNDIMERIRYAIARRPVRVAEAVIGLLGALGVVLLPEAEDAVYAVIGALVAAGIVGGEIAQTKTTPTKHARLDDGHAEDAL